MKLKLLDRLALQTILPREGDYAFISVRQDILEKVKVTQEEIKEKEIVSKDGMTKWNEKKDVGKEFDFTELESKTIKESLVELDKGKKLTDETFNLYKLFN